MKTCGKFFFGLTAFLLATVLAIGIAVSPLFAELKSYDKIKGWLPSPEHAIDPAKAGQFGDFVGGFIGTIIFTLSVVILLFTYLNQSSTNKRITFESRFFELLNYHRENVGEIALKNKKGRGRLFP